MATAIGTNTLSSLVRHFILDSITDQIYKSNVLLYRLIANNKRLVSGGTQIEVPLLYSRFNAGGTYRGFQVLATTPSDTIKNGALDWKQHYVPWSIDGLTLLKADSPDAIANILTVLQQQAYMEMAENLANGLFGGGYGASSDTGTDDIDGLKGSVGDSSTGNTSYAAISASSNSWWASQVDSSTTSITSMGQYQTAFSNATVGGQHPTLIVSRIDQYNKYIALNAQSSSAGYSVQYVREPGGHDQMLANAGFTNALYNNTPWVHDSHVTDAGNSSTGRIYFLNENVLQWVVSPRGDFYFEDFQKPVNQDAYVAMLLWAGNLVNMSRRLHSVFTGLTS
jgi:hypothetical protein